MKDIYEYVETMSVNDMKNVMVQIRETDIHVQIVVNW